ncbi:MAG: hypothetical protein IT345_10565 [Trueperaceae bacterium]|nr:hypothetical protein [Trueperaceae bacterium]
MTPKQYRSLARYMASIAKDFGLRDWALTLHDEPPDDPNALASVECVFGRRNAHVRVAQDFDQYPPEDQRTAILHELIHVHTEGLRALLRNSLPDLIGHPTFNALWAGVTQADEHATDALADAIAPYYPVWEG